MQTFEESGLNEALLKAVEELGYTKPTPIQAEAIPFLLGSKQDLIGLAQTGTGKTAAFGLPILNQLETKLGPPQAIILCPTRELCIQITNDMLSFSKFSNKVSIVPVYGGASIEKQIKEIKDQPQVIVGTPGRVVDMINRKRLELSAVNWLVLDEADEMLNMGFQEDLDFILENTKKERQTLLFSATMHPTIKSIVSRYMNTPKEITAGKANTGADNVTHYYYMVLAKNRYLALKRIVDINPRIYGIVFCRTRHETKDVADKLIQDGYNADALHGDLSQSQREHVMSRFRLKNLQLLVATDVAARGLDVHDITHIINYNLPDENAVYLHRSGRTGRAGKSGIALSIVHTKETRRVQEIEKVIGKKVERKEIPTGKEICEKQLFNLIDRVENTVVDDAQIEQYLPPIYAKLEWLNREDLIKRFVSVEFDRFLQYYKDAEEITLKGSDARERRDDRNNDRSGDERKSRRNKIEFQKYYLNIGSKQGLNKRSLLDLVNDQPGLKGIEIGEIEIMKGFSFFQADARFSRQVLSSLGRLDFNGNEILIEAKESDGPKKTFERKNDRRDSGDKKPYGERKQFGEKKKHRGKREYGDKKQYGENKRTRKRR